MTDPEQAPAAIAIADLLDRDLALLDQVEGLLLAASGAGETVRPVAVAHETGLGRETAANLFRQLSRVNAVTRSKRDRHVAESDYHPRSDDVRSVLGTARTAVAVLEADEERTPPSTTAQPLVTFPDDPEFDGVSPGALGFDQLFSALASAVKQTSDQIVLLAPFFEGEGFSRLHGVLINALDRGVDLTIVTRYLGDLSSHNRSVLTKFAELVRAEGPASGSFRTVDYTVWDDHVSPDDRRQDGATPAFTLHAKLMAFDDAAVYVGSANVTDYGFDRYLEVGVLLEGPPVSAYTDLCAFLLDSDAATEVRL